MKDLDTLLASLTPKQLALLDLKMRGSGTRATQAPEPALRPRQGNPPLSFAQERLWFLDQFEPNNAAYNLSLTIPLAGEVDDSVVRRALNEIIRRHEALRTTFVVVDGQPVQSIKPVEEINLTVLDLRASLEHTRQFQSGARIRQEMFQPFNLSAGPLIRGLLIHNSVTEHVLIITVHHIISDGWSLGVFMDEFNMIYYSLAQNRPISLPALPFQYADFAIWQRELLTGSFVDSLLDYWRRQLEGAPELLNLPLDFPMPRTRSFSGAAQYRALKGISLATISNLARSENGTLFIVMLAGFVALLHRYTGQNDIVVGSPVANRNRKELEPLIGFFVNTLVLRTLIPRQCTFRELIKRVRDVTIDAQARQDLPLERLVAELLSTRDTSRNPLFQVMFAVQNAVGSGSSDQLNNGPMLDMLGSQNLQPVPMSVKFDLTLTVFDHSPSMLTMWEYRTDLFNHATVARLAEHFETLLEAALKEPERPLMDLQLINEVEQLQLRSWAGSTSAEPDMRCLQELIEEQCSKTPNDVAVIWNDRELTFGELDRQANKVAHHLRSLGVGADACVGISTTRSPEMIIGIFAILKAGGAFLPLNPSYPQEQLTFIADEARLNIIIANENELPVFNAVVQQPATIICLDKWLKEQPDTEHVALKSNVSPENLAYVLYTSGSTGTPKGVMIPHGAIVNHMRWMSSTYPLNGADRVLQRTTTTFDASVWEIFAPLLSGARMVLSTGDSNDFELLPNEISRHGITVIQLVPSLLRMLLEETSFAQCVTLRRVYCGGEALTSDLTKRYYEQFSAPLINLYGPTETTIEVTSWQCPKDHPRPTLPIGRPITNAQIYILDQDMNLLPPGSTGELYIGGDCLGRGYLARPELTAQAFVPSPFGNPPGARLYRTGDLARYLPNGLLEFAGRNDNQVKVRGFRIELTAVEAALLRHPEIKAAAVVNRDDGFGNTHLIAYATSNGGLPPTSAALRGFLAHSLPSHMIPSAFVFLEALPLLPSGKIDRVALAQMNLAGPLLQEEYVAPQNEIESKLAEIWIGVLGLDRIGVKDNFFALGGHSLLASQVATRIRDTFDLEFSLSRIFEAPTISELAVVVQNLVVERASKTEQPDPLNDARVRNLIDNIDELSEQEIEALLIEFQNRPEAGS